MAISKQRRNSLFQKSDKKCHYCNVTIISLFHLEHKISKMAGGTDEDSNLVISCAPCNDAKGVRTYNDFKNMLRIYGLDWRDREAHQRKKIYQAKKIIDHPEKIKRTSAISNPRIGWTHRERILRRRAKLARFASQGRS